MIVSVSQMQASEKILSKEATVVGWYHSHPTFDPNPSVRDIQTQEDFQVSRRFSKIKEFVNLVLIVSD